MSSIDYRRHFALLLLSAALLPLLVEQVFTILPGGGLPAYLGSVGLLYATVWVLSLHSSTSFRRGLAFLLIGTALSICAPYFGAVVAMLLSWTEFDVRLFSLFVGGSAFGALTYWFVVRGFWLPHLPLWSLALAIVICVAATSAMLLVGGLESGFGEQRDTTYFDLPTSFWWLAFSSSVLLADRLANQGLNPTPHNGVTMSSRGAG